MLRNTANAWGAPARALHWAVALVVLAQFVTGWLAASWRLSPAKLDLYVWHKSTGLLVLALMAVRIAWRLANPAPALPAGTPALERRAAGLAHLLLYLLLIAMPLSGWVIASASGIPFRIYWQIPLPAIVAPDEAVAGLAARVHLALFVALAALLVAHVGAALRHHFVTRDGVLRRMMSGTGEAP
jgi:cytochrome b561